MYYKKNVASYFVWILYLMVVGTAASFIGLVLTTTFGMENPLIALLIVNGYFGVMFLLYMAGGVIASRLKDPAKEPGKQKIWIEAILVTVFLAAGLLLRVLMIGGAGEEAAYYAVVENSNGSFPFVQGSVCYYLNLLHGLFLLLGNHWIAGVWLQVALQYVGCVLAYFAVRKLSGSFPAVWVVGCIMLMPTSIRAGMTYSPKQMYFCLLAFGMLLAAFLLQRCEKPDTPGWIPWVLAVINGLYIGFAGYTDVLGFLLMIPMLGLLGIRREEDSLGKRIGLTACALGTAVLFFFGLLFIDSAVSATGFGRVLGAWVDTYAPGMISLDILLTETDQIYMILMVLSAIGVFSFWRRRREDAFCPWLLSIYVMLALQIFGIVTEYVNGSYIWFFFLAVLSGISVRELFHVEPLEKEETAETAEAERKPLPAVGRTSAPQGNARTERPSALQGNARTERPSASQGNARTERPSVLQGNADRGRSPETSPVAAAESLKGRETAPKAPEQKKVNYIENPLPLPRRHVRRGMDYAFEPSPSMMKYDIDVKDNDDYDIRF